MRYSGRSFGYEETGTRISDAIITENRLAIDWLEDGYPASLIVTSDDGLQYQGTFGYPAPEERYRVEFRRFNDQTGEVILIGRWWQSDMAEGGNWMLRLSVTS